MKMMSHQHPSAYSYQPMPLCYDKDAQSAVRYKLDLNKYCIKKPQETFFMHVSNTNLTAWGIEAGDVLVVERSNAVNKGDLVVIAIAGQLSIFEVFSTSSVNWVLFPLDSTQSCLQLASLNDVDLQGVVTNTIHQVRRRVA
ncbi:DNA polymerase V subunit UmuD [Pasteurellaceae bacterium HPA106]|uniref:S24 family peptidase n=1 Tax=Spirabiliibacterium pneumoniae TaxID=221400 RepID=UPI001AAC87C5|nr:S24 family peptidase [Spirabiliibacterium pneumoniae]MBE2895418.1 DNA polymerase V subunit UmuD [Spirabiliibacterium pneumoniae]